eukprot:519064_1
MESSLWISFLCLLASVVNSINDLNSWSNMNMSVDLSGHIAGYDNVDDSFWLIGGTIDGSPNYKTYKFYPATLELIASTIINGYYYANAQTYITYGRSIYFVSETARQYVTKFNMDPPEITANFATKPNVQDPCATICSSNIMYIIGGVGTAANFTQTLNLDTLQWNIPGITAQLNWGRSSPVCECVNDALWVIGGDRYYVPSPISVTTSIEYYHTQSSSKWIEIVDTLGQRRSMSKSVVVGIDIFVVGGWGPGVKPSVDIVHTATKTVSSGISININRYQHALLYSATVNKIFVSGGSNGASYLFDWEVSNELTPTNEPTIDPTLEPTNIPTHITSGPTSHPSKSPSKYPTKYPSETPTSSPSKYPSKYPTGNPSKFPSIYPSQDPTR